MKNIIKQKVAAADSIVILSHINQDADALGSSFALRDVLRHMGKKAVCCIDEKPEKKLGFLGDDYILSDDAENEYDLCVVLDCGSIDRLGDRYKIYESCRDRVSIDHHGTNTMFASYNYVEADASATGEILFYLFKEWGFELTDKAAMYLYCAIASDCGCFKYSCTSKRTMLAAAELMDFNFDHADVCLKLFDTVEENTMKLHAWVMDNVRSYENGKIRVISTNEEILKKFGVDERDAGNMVNIPRSVAGTIIAAELKMRNGEIRVSLRSNDAYDVAAIATALGGGGHERAAGAKVDALSLEEAERLIVDMITERYFGGKSGA